MSRVFDALQHSEAEGRQKSTTMLPVASGAVAVQEITNPRLNEAAVVEASALPSVVALNEENSLAAEKFRVLGARLRRLCDQQTFKLIQVTSSVVGEGKSFVASNLAFTLAQRNLYKVLLIDGDLRKATIEPLLGLERARGLGDWWREDGPPNQYLRKIGATGVWLLSAGAADSPQQVLQSSRTRQFIAELSAEFDWVIIDSPPVVPVADANLWARIADGMLLVVREGMTPRHSLENALKGLDDPKLLGIVLNDASDQDRARYYDSYYGAPDKSGKDKATKKGNGETTRGHA